MEILERIEKIKTKSAGSINATLRWDKELSLFIFNNTTFLNKYKNVKMTERFYCFINKLKDRPKCIVCVKNVNFLDCNRGYSKSCSRKCSKKSSERNEKISKTQLEIFSNKNKKQEIINKRKNTKKERYGNENAFCFHSKELNKIIKDRHGDEKYNNRDKYKSTCLEKYGVDHVFKNQFFRKKADDTIREKYGVDNISQKEEIKEKKRKTSMKNYGVSHPMQNKEYFYKRQYKYKPYTLPNGVIVNIQGYEDLALDELFEKYSVEEILIGKGNIPVIWYYDKDTKRRYYPDFYIPNENLIIEVKSEYTYKIKERINLLKRDACLNAGYNFKFMIMEK